MFETTIQSDSTNGVSLGWEYLFETVIISRFRLVVKKSHTLASSLQQKPQIAASSLHVPGIADATDVHTINNKQNNSNQPMKLRKEHERRVKQWEAGAKTQTNKLTSQSGSELLPTSRQPLSQLSFFLVLYKPTAYPSSKLSAEIVKNQLSNSKNWITGGWSQHRHTYSTISCVNCATLSQQHYKHKTVSL